MYFDIEDPPKVARARKHDPLQAPVTDVFDAAQAHTGKWLRIKHEEASGVMRRVAKLGCEPRTATVDGEKCFYVRWNGVPFEPKKRTKQEMPGQQTLAVEDLL